MVNATYEALMLHVSRDNISKMLAEIAGTTEAVPLRTVDDMIRRAKDRMEAEAFETGKAAKKAFIARQFAHIRRAVQKGNLPVVSRHEKLIGDTQGIFAPVRVEASTPPGQPIEVSIRDPRKMTSAERRKRLAELEAKRQATLAATTVAKPSEQG